VPCHCFGFCTADGSRIRVRLMGQRPFVFGMQRQADAIGKPTRRTFQRCQFSSHFQPEWISASCLAHRTTPIRLWDAETGDAIGRPTRRTFQVMSAISSQFSPDGVSYCVWAANLTTPFVFGMQRQVIPSYPPRRTFRRCLFRQQFSPDGSRIDFWLVRIEDHSSLGCRDRMISIGKPLERTFLTCVNNSVGSFT